MRGSRDFHVVAPDDYVFNHNHAVERRSYHAARINVFETSFFQRHGVKFARTDGIFRLYGNTVHRGRVVTRVA